MVVGGPEIDVERVDLDELAAAAAGMAGRPLNVEVVRTSPGADDVTLRVHERGVGETAACGTGSCAAAAVAHDLGLVGRRVRVHNPGGVLEVELRAPSGTPGHEVGGPSSGHGVEPEELTAVLEGPVRHVADVDLAGTALAGAVGEAPAP